jgi:S1-C subfamily serine protease
VAVGAAPAPGGARPAAEGVVSALEVTMSTPGTSLSNLIRSDAVTSPVQGGGPLLDAQGRAIGLTAVVSQPAPGAGYAMAIDSIRSVIQQLEQGQGALSPQSATMGAQTLDVAKLTPADIARYGVQTSDGAMVVEVDRRSSAADAGLQVGDVITAIDALPVNSSSDLDGAVQYDHAGQRVTITFERQGQIHNVAVVLRSRRDTGN